MTPLDAHLADRFGPVFDVLNDAGGVPDELMECLKWGAVWELMGVYSRNSGQYVSLNLFSDTNADAWIETPDKQESHWLSARIKQRPIPLVAAIFDRLVEVDPQLIAKEPVAP